MRQRFNLLDRAWIPVRWIDGRVETIGLATALCQADRIATLECSTPLRQIAMLRLLLAVAHRADRLPSIDAAVARLNGTWPAEKFRQYLDTWAACFDLYDQDRPFLQAPWLGQHEKTATREHPLARIRTEWSSGNSKLLMDHHHEAGVYVEPADEVAQVLIAHQQFCVGGLSKVFKDSAIGGPGMGFAHIWVTAPTLGRFLTLNQLQQSEVEYCLDLPAWECAPISAADLLIDHLPFPGPASRYCHISRSVLLLPDSNGGCRSLRWAEGIARSPNDAVLDPMEAQRRGKDDTWLSLRLSEERAIWRDSQCLVINATNHPPAVVRNAMQVLEESGDSSPVTLGIGGLLADKAKLVLWRIEQITAPLQVLESVQLQGVLALGLEAAEQAGRGLYGACSELARYLLQENGDADKAAVRDVVNGFPGTRHFWHQLDVAFPHFLQKLQSPEAINVAINEWRDAVRGALQRAWRETVRSTGRNRKSIVAAAKAESAYVRTENGLNQKLGVST